MLHNSPRGLREKGGLTMEDERWSPRWGLKAWDPLRSLEDMPSLEDIYDKTFWPTAWRRLPAEEMCWAPAVEMLEKADRYLVKVELPGVSEDEIDVSLVGDSLVISGERKSGGEAKEESYYYGKFSRTIALPPNIDVDKIEASYDKGLLEITIPKARVLKTKKIPVVPKKKAVK